METLIGMSQSSEAYIACLSYEEEDTCMSYEEEDTCMSESSGAYIPCGAAAAINVPCDSRTNTGLLRLDFSYNKTTCSAWHVALAQAKMTRPKARDCSLKLRPARWHLFYSSPYAANELTLLIPRGRPSRKETLRA
jgi:hypothetical protein